MEAPELISINSSLNRKAKFFGFLPISQVMPIGVIAFLSFLYQIAKYLLQID